MKRVTIFTIAVLSFSSCSGQNHSSSIILTAPQLESKVDALVKQYLDLDIFSGVVLIVEKSKPVYHKAFGLANRGKNIPNTLDTRFDIGSINKAMTKVVIMQLIQEGKLKPDDNLGKYLKGVPKVASDKVTIQHLISHTSGYGDYLEQPGFFDRPKSQQTIAAIIEMIKGMPLMFEPGEGHEYSNAGYVLLGGIIEAVTGKSYYDNINERILKPLGMNDTVVDETKEASPKRAIGYMKTMRGMLENNEGILMVPTPAGGFITTAPDLLKFMEAYFYTDMLVTEESRKLDDFYPYFEKAKRDGNAIPVAGGFEGANAVAYNVLRDEITIIVLANMDEPVAEQLADGIFKIIRGKEPSKPSLPAMQRVYKAFNEKGIEYMKQNFEELSDNFPPQDPKDILLNNMGYNLLFSGEIDEAIQIFKLNTELFPNIANCWDSYGESLLKKGSKKEALRAYEKALSLNPNLPSAIKAVKTLKQ